MKLIDRYILRRLFSPLLYSLLAFVIVYIIYDLFDNLEDFVEAGTPFLEVLQFYALLMPSVLIYIVPVSMLIATLFSLSQLTRHNEIVALRASGISLYRLIGPIALVGFLAGLLVSGVHETVGPWSAYWTEQFVQSQQKKGEVNVHLAHNIPYRNVEEGRIWFIQQFDQNTYEMRHVRLVQQRPDGSEQFQLQARVGSWRDREWWFEDVAIQRYDPNNNPAGPPEYHRNYGMPGLTETPRRFLTEIRDPMFLSARDLYTYIQTHPHLSEDVLDRNRVDLHHRLAMPWACFVVTLLGIPFGTYSGRKGAMQGIFLSLILFFGYYVLINLCLLAGKEQFMPPWLAAWAPNLLFLTVGAVLIVRMR